MEILLRVILPMIIDVLSHPTKQGFVLILDEVRDLVLEGLWLLAKHE